MQPLSREFLIQRGYCCHLGCRNCPWKDVMIERYLTELKDTWSYTPEELTHIKTLMASYAFNACIDSVVRKEAERIVQLDEKFGSGMNRVADAIEEDLDNE